ncbi:MAG: hypothetical protein KAU17_15560 [Spirochaetales bacterium]|nr:hypothetical protein [Spirochaetales bacterium]
MVTPEAGKGALGTRRILIHIDGQGTEPVSHMMSVRYRVYHQTYFERGACRMLALASLK